MGLPSLLGWTFGLRGLAWPDNLRPEDESNNSPDLQTEINFKELWVAREVIRREAFVLRGWRVVLRIDNKAAVHYVCCRYGHSLRLQSLAESFEFAERAAGCWCLAVRPYPWGG